MKALRFPLFVIALALVPVAVVLASDGTIPTAPEPAPYAAIVAWLTAGAGLFVALVRVLPGWSTYFNGIATICAGLATSFQMAPASASIWNILIGALPVVAAGIGTIISRNRVGQPSVLDK